MIMGNASAYRREEAGPSGAKSEEEVEEEEGEEHMEDAQVSYNSPAKYPERTVHSHPYSPRAYHSPLLFTPQASITLQRPEGVIQYQSDVPKKSIPTMIKWNHEGNKVAIEGSWDNWKTREFLQRSDRDLTTVKVLPEGVYHYRFIVDGQWRCAPELPQQCDDMGNIFNILDLREHIGEIPDNTGECESPPSPLSSYNNATFSSEDFNEKLPELPPLLQRTPLDLPTFSTNILQEKPLSGILNHLYVQKTPSPTGESMAALSSTQRFRKKYVTVLLYKSLDKLKASTT